jgi:hypothetical protein
MKDLSLYDQSKSVRRRAIIADRFSSTRRPSRHPNRSKLSFSSEMRAISFHLRRSVFILGIDSIKLLPGGRT